MPASRGQFWTRLGLKGSPQGGWCDRTSEFLGIVYCLSGLAGCICLKIEDSLTLIVVNRPNGPMFE